MDVPSEQELRRVAHGMLAAVGPMCRAIYLGGSKVNGVIANPHETDFVLVFDAKDRQELKSKTRIAHEVIREYAKREGIDVVTSVNYYDVKSPDCIDAIQSRSSHCMVNAVGSLVDEHDQGSYIDRQMILLAGEPSIPDYDVLGKDRDDYVYHLKRAVRLLLGGSLRISEKRWYQVCIGTCILENGSYELTDRQRDEANVLHDMAPETAEERKRLKADLARRVSELI